MHSRGLVCIVEARSAQQIWEARVFIAEAHGVQGFPPSSCCPVSGFCSWFLFKDQIQHLEEEYRSSNYLTRYIYLYTVHRAPYTVHLTPFTVHRTLYTVHGTPYTVHGTPYTVYCKKRLQIYFYFLFKMFIVQAM